MKICQLCGHRKKRGPHVCQSEPPVSTRSDIDVYLSDKRDPNEQLDELRRSVASFIYRLSEPVDDERTRKKTTK